VQPKGLLKFLRLEGFAQNVKEYVENQIAITKLEAKQKVADVGSTIAALVPAALFGFFALIFLSLTLAMAINVWLDSRVWGFLIVGVLYLIGAGVMFSMRDSVWLKKKIVDGSTKFLKEQPQKEKDKQENEDANTNQTSPVEHKKVIFEDMDADEEATTADREHYVTTADTKPHKAATADREPLSKTNTVTEVRTTHNAAIIETEDTDREERS
jgi:hypothetical protein